MSRSKEMDLTTGNPFWSLLKFAIPVILGNLFQLFYTLADSVIVGKTLGAESLAAVGSTSIIIYFVFCFINGFTGGFGICLGQRCGAKDEKGMRKSIAVSTLLSIAFTVVLTLVCCLLAHQILSWMQIPEDISGEAYDYMFVVLLGTGATVFYNMISNMLRALGDSKTPLYFLVFSSVLNIFLDILFIVPLHMGVAGAAVATVAGQFLSMCLGQIVLFKGKHPVKVKLFGWKFNKRIVKDIYAVGAPAILMQSIASIMQFGMNIILGAMSETAVAVMGVYGRLQSFIFMPVFGLNQGVLPIMGFNYGAKNRKRLMETFKKGFFIAFIIMGVGLVIFQLFPRELLSIFNSQNSQDMFDIGIPALRTISLCFLRASFGIMASSIFQATGHGFLSLWGSLLRQLVGILPLAWLFSVVGGLDLVWYSFPLAELIGVVYFVFALKHLYKNEIRRLDILSENIY